MLLDDRLLSINPFSPVCSLCKHWMGGMLEPRRCRAFGSDPIPEEIWEGKNLHTKPVKGDNGVLFEKVDETDLFPEKSKA